MALGQEPMARGIRTCYEQARPYPRHEEAMGLYRQYLVVGGMPRAVAAFAETGSFEEVREVQAEIDQTYIADMPMAQAALCRAIWDSVPASWRVRARASSNMLTWRVAGGQIASKSRLTGWRAPVLSTWSGRPTPVSSHFRQGTGAPFSRFTWRIRASCTLSTV